jgi:ligand-binding sensor domain-containing protein/signal transduction histidine kinase/DNA-binding response OmpR family regulator
MKFCHVLIFFLFYQIALCQENKPVLFSHLTTNDGLSESFVTCILKDKYGFLWFGTGDGLNKYDGHKFKVFRNKPDDSKTIPYNSIVCLFEDKAGELWIGTSGGVAKYNRNDDSFTSYGGGTVNSIFESSDGTVWVGTFQGPQILDRKAQKVIPARSRDNQYSSIEYSTSCIYEDGRGNLWIGTANGLFLYNRKQRKIQNIEYSRNQNQDGKSWVISIIEDRSGFFWVGAENGLHAFSYKNDGLLIRRNDIKVPEILSGRITSIICLNKDGTLWVGKESGLILFDPKNGTTSTFQKKAHDEQSLSHNSIRSLYLDDQEILWIGTYGGGLNKYDKNQFLFGKYQIYSLENPSLISNVVTSFEEDHSGNMWIGTDGGGLFLWETANNRFIPFYPGSQAHYFPSYTVMTIKLSKNKKYLWVGTYDQGLVELNIKTKSMRFFNIENKKLNDNFVTSILEDRNGKLWIGTNNKSVTVIDPSNGEVDNNLNNKVDNNLNNNTTIRALCEDADGKIWIGTYGGVSIYNPSTKSFSYLTEGNSNVSNIIYSIFKDSKNNMWVGSMGGGLYLFNSRTEKLTAFSESKGLASNIVNSIVEDAQGYLWISTSRGISRFNPGNGTFKNYTREDGLQSNEFVRGAGYITKAGRIFFGSIDGFNAFYPEDNRINSNIPNIVITDFQLSNKSLPAEMYNPQLKQNSNGSPQIILPYNESVFSIEFAALSYTVPEKNQYAYMLQGFDKDWNYVGYEHKATYTNLSPGEYTFKVIASNNDGVWNKEGTSLKIIITPPLWKTGIAYILYLLIAIGILYYIYREIKARERLKNEIIFQKMTVEKIEELNQMKLNFFTNISHELRTPLSLIMDPISKIVNEEVTVAKAKTLGNLAFKNAARLSNLVNQLLDFRKFGGQYKLETQHINLIEIIKEICLSFEEKARKREIEFDLGFNTVFKDAWMDVDKLEKILTNLISNSFKYTPNGGKIQVLVSTFLEKNEKRSLEIRVKDTGPGVPQADKKKIFDLFFQVEGTKRYDMESSGIGLSLTRELVLLHGGEISEVGKEGEGAVFVVKLPLQKYIPPKEMEFSGTEMGKEGSVVNIPEVSGNDRTADHLSEVPIILVVEDNQELREYIAAEVLSRYHVEQAVNGIEGFEKALALVPDLIISDIMMPDGNGIELCGKLKADEKTSHIPVILLTAKQTDENKIEGYRTGADAYISKPFNSTLLNTQVQNLLESRKKLRALFSRVETRHPVEAGITDIDKEFLRKTEQIVLDNLSNAQFDVDSFAEKLKMNRRQFYRKFKAISDQTPHEYIIIIRLRVALDLLLAGDLNVSEVGYQVGFSDPAHFTRTFTKVYGKSPRKYISDLSNRSE